MVGLGVSPVKTSGGPVYGELEYGLTESSHNLFGMPSVNPTAGKKKIKKADRISAWMEAVQIAGFSKEEATKLFGKPDSDVIDGLSIVLRTPVETRKDFTARHHVLLKEMP